MTFGPEGFFAYTPCTKSSLDPPSSSPSSEDDSDKYIMWWSNYETYPAPDRNAPLADIYAQLTTRHGFWKHPYDTPQRSIYPSIIDLACGSPNNNNADSTSTPAPALTAAEKKVLVLPRYITPRLSHWASPSGRIILIGDAAHAMPPDSGQGVSCAVEDSLSLGLLLKHYLTFGPTSAEEPLSVAEVLKKTKGAYEDVRMPRVKLVLDHAKRVGERKKKQTWLQEKVRDWMIWTICEFVPTAMCWEFWC
jgi:hypothetical protein